MAVVLVVRCGMLGVLGVQAYLLSSVVPARISVPLHPGASAASIDATLEDLLQTMGKAEPTDLKARTIHVNLIK